MTEWIIAAVVIAIAGIIIYNRIKETTARPTKNTHRTTPQQNSAVSLSQKTETGPMVYYANDRYGNTDREYRFNYKKIDGSWRAYILRMPSLENRDAGGIPTHRLWDDDNNAYICWNKAVSSLNDMQNISRVWADRIQEYIATEKRF